MDVSRYSYRAESEADTARLAAALAEVLPPGSVVGLNGPLGAGKTRFVKALAAAAGANPADVTSPTFVLMQQYAGRLPIYHLDAYRLRDEDDSGGWTVIEWSQRVASCLPDDRLDIRIEIVGPTAREFTLTARGGFQVATLRALAAALTR
jgi:tRNA threonylcarbamoyladenosine biosynthesis protein TsaE